jgi:integrase
MRGPSLHTAINSFLDALADAGVPAGTRKQYRSVLYRLVRVYPERQYSSVTTRDLSAFLYGPKGIAVGRAPGTATSQRAALRSFFAWGHQMVGGKLVTVPTPVIRQRQPRPETRPTRLPAATLVQLLESCDPDDDREVVLRGVLAVTINTAWRISDAVKPRVHDLGLVTGDLWFVSRKTGKADSFPITLDLDEELRRYMSWYTATTGVTLDHSDAFLFPGWTKAPVPASGGFSFSPDPRRHASEEWARNGLKRLFDRCGVRVEKGEAWHTVRRSVARIYFDSLRGEISYDHALRQTAALLQHDSVVTTERYLGLDAEVQARDASLKGQRFIGVRAPGNVQSLRTA